MTKRHQAPVQYAALTTTQRDAIKSPLLGMKIFNTTLSANQTYEVDGWTTDLTLAVLPLREDAIVDSDTFSSITGLFTTLKGVIDGNHIAILIKKMADTSAITIASGAKVQRLQGKDADTTTVPVDIESDKANVTFEQLGFSSKALKIDHAAGNTMRALLFSASGVLSVGVAICAVSLRAQI